jgi:hypothetical protein
MHPNQIKIGNVVFNPVPVRGTHRAASSSFEKPMPEKPLPTQLVRFDYILFAPEKVTSVSIARDKPAPDGRPVKVVLGIGDDVFEVTDPAIAERVAAYFLRVPEAD